MKSVLPNASNPVHPKPARHARRTLLFALAALALCLFASYRADQRCLAETARQVIAGRVAPTDRVLALMTFVRNELPSRRNPSRFLRLPFGATPVQVLQQGGDCADKSRLLVAMLRTQGIPATPVMSFDSETGLPAHTFVEARPAPGEPMVVDPAYGLAFPRESGGYYGLLDLRRDPSIVDRHLATAPLDAGADRAVARYYLRPGAPYDSASTFNWNRNFLTRSAQSVLSPLVGENLHAWPRPAVVEEPKLVSLSLLALGTLFIVSLNPTKRLIYLLFASPQRRGNPSGQIFSSRTAIPGAVDPGGMGCGHPARFEIVEVDS